MSDPTSASSANYVLLTQLADEFAARYRAGERPSVQEYIDRYPHLAADIRELFPTMVEMEQVKDAQEAVERTGQAAPTIRQLGDFRILREVGKGGMGIVYEAEQISLGRHVALKVLPKNMLLDAKAKRRFEREAKSAARLHHTNIVPVFGVGEQDGMPYYVMQFIQGLGLDEVIDELEKLQQSGAKFGSRMHSDLRVSGHADRPQDLPEQATRPKIATEGARSAVNVAHSLLTGGFQPEPDRDGDETAALVSDGTGAQITGPDSALAPSSSGSFTLSSSSVTLPGQNRDSTKSKSKKRSYWQSVAIIGVQVAQAMEYAHKQGIHHRDIKPSNLLLDAQGTVWVTDFGLAKADDQQNLTHTGDVLGTLRYMPPEAFEGKTDARGDVYSLGLTLFEMLAFRAAFNEKDRNRLIRQVTDAEPDRLMKINPQVPRDLETIVHKAIDKDPGRRYATAAALANDLQRFIDDEPILARRVSQVERLGRWSRRHKAVAALLVTLATVLSTGFVVMAVLWSESKDQARRATTLATREMEARAQLQRLAAKEEKARGEAQQQERLAVEKAELLAREDYVNRVNRAYREVQDDNVALAEDLLHGCDLKRRGWEWSFVERLCNSERRVVSIGNTSVNAIAYSPDGSWAVSGSGAIIIGGASEEATTVRVWDAGSGQPRKTLTGAKGTVFDVAVGPDGKTVAAGFSDGLVMVWDVETGQSVWAQSEPGLNAMSLDFSRDGKSLAVGYGIYSGNQVGRVKVWDVVSGKEIKAFKGPTGGVNNLAFHPDGKRLAVAGSAVVEVWDVETARKLQEFKGHEKWVYCLAFSPDGKWLATGGWDRTVKLWDAATGALALTIFAHEGFVLNLAFSPDSRDLVTASEDRSTRLWEVPSGRRLATFHGHTDFVHTVAFRPDGREVATGSLDGSIRFWDMKTSRPVVVEHTGWVEQLAFRRDGLRVLSLSELDHYGTNALATKGWSPLTGELDAALAGIKFDALPKEFVPEPRYPVMTAISPDGKLIAAAVGNGGSSGASRSKGYSLSSVIVRESRTGKIVHTLTGHSADVVSLAFSPDSRRLATASYDRTVKLWDMESGQAVFALLGHTAGVVSVAFSPDGNQIVTGGIDYTARVWNATPLPADTTALHDARYQTKVETLSQLNAATDDRERAKILVANGQWSMAAEIFASIVAKEPGSLEARYQLIDTLLKASDTKRAAIACGEALEQIGGSKARSLILEFTARSDELLSFLTKQRPDDRRIQLAQARKLMDRGRRLVAEKQVAKALTELSKSQEIYVRLLGKLPAQDWTVLKPDELKSRGGATLSPQDDGSILASGANPDRDTYTITAQVPIPRVTAIRLEALPDPSMPFGTAGRAAVNGNFGLSEWTVTAQPKNSADAPRAIRWRDAASDHWVGPAEHYSRRLMHIGLAIDGDPQTYWDILSKRGLPHWAIFQPAEPIERARDVTLKLTLHFWSGQHNLGRFRLSVSGDEAALDAEQLKNLKGSEVAELNILLARAYAEQGHTSEAADSFTSALDLSADRATKATIIKESSALPGMLETLAKQAAGDWLFQAELGRHFSEKGNPPMAVAALGVAVAKEPSNLQLRYELIEALMKAGVMTPLVAACDDMLARFGKTSTPYQVMAVAGFCRLARTAAENHSKRPVVHELATAKTDDERLSILAKQEQWDLVYQCMTRIVEAQPKNWGARSWLVLSLLESGDIAGYRIAAGDLISRFQNDSDSFVLNNAAWWCTYAPNAVTDLGVPVRMAEAALAGYPPNQKRFALNTLGAALYRAGRIDDAITLLDESVKTSGGGGVPQDWVFLAMAHRKKGHVEEARRWLEKVRAYVKDEKNPFSSGLVETRYLLEEALALFGGDAAARP